MRIIIITNLQAKRYSTVKTLRCRKGLSNDPGVGGTYPGPCLPYESLKNNLFTHLLTYLLTGHRPGKLKLHEWSEKWTWVVRDTYETGTRVIPCRVLGYRSNIVWIQCDLSQLPGTG